MTIEETAAVMDVLTVAYPDFLRKQRNPGLAIQLWAELLEPYPLNLVMAAVKSLIATDEKGFPPVPGQVLGKIRQLTDKAEPTEAEAWGLVHRAIKNGLYGSQEEFDRLPPDIQRSVHAPEQLKEWAKMDAGEVETVVASNFMRSYRVISQRRKEYEALPEDVRQMLDGMSGELLLEGNKRE